jgi:hypothetical protein
MTYDWFNIFNLTEFLATGLVSRTVTVILGNYGEKEILITKGNVTSISYDGTLLPLQFAGRNPYAFGGYAVYQDTNNDVWLGIEIPE